VYETTEVCNRTYKVLLHTKATSLTTADGQRLLVRTTAAFAWSLLTCHITVRQVHIFKSIVEGARWCSAYESYGLCLIMILF
jgi:hypothetical protein